MKQKTFPFQVMDLKEDFFVHQTLMGMEALRPGEQRRMLRGCITIRSFYCLKSDEQHIYFGVYHINRYAVGDRLFNKAVCAGSLSLGKKGLYMSGTLEHNMYVWFFTKLNKEWFVKELQEVKGSIRITSKTLLKAVLLDKITNKEALYKYILKNQYRALNVISWRQLERFYKTSIPMSLYDILAFTANPRESLEAVLRTGDSSTPDYDASLMSLYRDMLTDASFLDEKIKFTWSRRRLEEHHSRQNLLLNSIDIEKTDKTPIYDEALFTGMFPTYAEPLISEYQTCSLGFDMSNCIHRCYWDRIRSHQYFAVLFIIDDKKVLLGMRVGNGQLEYDQCYGPYNTQLTPKEEAITDGFFAFHKKELYDIITKTPVLAPVAPVVDPELVDIPW